MSTPAENSEIQDFYPYKGEQIRGRQYHESKLTPNFGVAIGTHGDWMDVEWQSHKDTSLVKLSLFASKGVHLQPHIEQVGEVMLEEGEDHLLNRNKYDFSRYVSEKHLKLTVGTLGIVLFDRGSTNGTRIYRDNEVINYNSGFINTSENGEPQPEDPFERFRRQDPPREEKAKQREQPRQEPPRSEKPKQAPKTEALSGPELLMARYGDRFKKLGLVEFSICDMVITDLKKRFGNDKKVMARNFQYILHPDSQHPISIMDSIPEDSKGDAYLFVKQQLGL